MVTLVGEYLVQIQMEPQERWGRIMWVGIRRMWLELIWAMVKW